jgi:lysozyme
VTTPFLLPDLQAELNQLEGEEGCRLSAYQDENGVWTIGYGHTGSDVVPGLVWTQGQADAQLAADLGSTVARLAQALPWFTTLDDIRQDVLADMAFNLGVAGLLTFTTTLGYVESGAYAMASAAMLMSDWADEVGDRAQTLAIMMKTGARP